MYVDIGDGCVIDGREIIGFFDLDKTTVFKVNKNYLSNTQKKGKIVNATEKLPKSFVVCSEDKKEKVYISRLLPFTLYKRCFGGGKNQQI